MTEPRRVEFDLPNDKYSRQTRLIGENDGSGAMTWTIKSDPINQLDDGEIIRSLTTAQLNKIGEIAATYRKVGAP